MKSAPARPRVSVALVTRNHEGFIGQAIDSVLQQKTSFPIEIVIGDDASDDGTRAILAGYAGRHPNVRLVMAPQRRGIAANYIHTLSACGGEFVAMLDGDDYWVRPDKLEKQVALLDSNSSCRLSFHNVMKVYDDASQPPAPFCAADQKRFTGLRELLVSNYMPTSSVVYRRDADAALPPWLLDLRFVDWPLHVLNVGRGTIGYLDEVMGVYRIHSAGDWMSMGPVERTRAIVKIYESLLRAVDEPYRGQVHSLLAIRHFQLARLEVDRGDVSMARREVSESFRLGWVADRVSRRARWSLLTDVYFPLGRRVWQVMRGRTQTLASDAKGSSPTES